jgi:hypothetical protein
MLNNRIVSISNLLVKSVDLSNCKNSKWKQKYLIFKESYLKTKTPLDGHDLLFS